MVIAAAEEQVGHQLGTIDSYDVKALGLLTVAVTLLGLLVTFHGDPDRFWWGPLPGLAAASLILGWAVVPRTYRMGAELREFYRAYGYGPAQAAREQMLSHLVDAVDENDNQLTTKKRAFDWGSAVLALSLSGGAALFGVVR